MIGTMWCSQCDSTRMSRNTTTSSYPSTRSGVPTSPSRSGSSPAQRISVRTAASASSREGRVSPVASEAISPFFKILFMSFPSVEPALEAGCVERKGRDLNVEVLAGLAHHLVGAAHEARGRGERRARSVLERMARAQHWRLADHAGAPDLLEPPQGVGDLPVAAAQLHRQIALVLDADLIGPDKVRFFRIGLFRQILRPDSDLNGTGCGCVHRATCPER